MNLFAYFSKLVMVLLIVLLVLMSETTGCWLSDEGMLFVAFFFGIISDVSVRSGKMNSLNNPVGIFTRCLFSIGSYNCTAIRSFAGRFTRESASNFYFTNVMQVCPDSGSSHKTDKLNFIGLMLNLNKLDPIEYLISQHTELLFAKRTPYPVLISTTAIN